MQCVILTKHRVYELAPDAQGVPAETDFSGAAPQGQGIGTALARIIHEEHRLTRMSAEILAFCRVTGTNSVSGG
jgi:hypothetical protein